MQLFAIDKQGKPIFANHASKQMDYTCFECGSVVRLRGGVHRQNHFYHLDPTRICRQQGKSLVHLQVQMHLFQLFPEGECRLEERFKEMGRIADVVWIPHRLVFEVQCALISAEEVLQRNRDYAKLGWQVIWILHDYRYNQARLTAAEFELKSHPHYFTNINQNGQGAIYDQFDIAHKGFRKEKMKPLPIQLLGIKKVTAMPSCDLPLVLRKFKSFSYYFEGDLMDQWISHSNEAYMQECLQREQNFLKLYFSKKSFSLLGWVHWLWIYGIVRPYSLCFQMLLERLCR